MSYGAAAGAGAQALGSIGGAYAESQALKTQGEYQRMQYEMNARLAGLQAQDAIKRGDKAAVEVKRRAKRVIGSQRAALAAQGIEVDSGSAAQIQADTVAQSTLDVLEIKNNAWREAWGYRFQASDYMGRGRFAEMAAKASATNTLLTGGMNAITSLAGGLSGYGGGGKKT